MDWFGWLIISLLLLVIGVSGMVALGFYFWVKMIGKIIDRVMRRVNGE